MKLLSIISISLLLSCANNNSTNTEAPQPAPVEANGNKAVCTVDNTTYTAFGNNVEIGSFGTNGKELSLSISMNAKNTDGNTVYITTSLLKMPLTSGNYSLPEMGADGYNLGEYRISTPNGDLVKKYTGADYFLYYATDSKNDELAKLKFTVARFEKTESEGMINLMHIKMKGNFSFNAAATKSGVVSEECMKEAIERGLKKEPLFPKYNANLCGAEKKSISCEFEIETDVPLTK